MGLFSNIMSKIFGSPAAATQAPPASAPAPASPVPATAGSPGSGGRSTARAPAPSASAAGAVSAPPPLVDVTLVLDGLAAKNPEKLDWRRSIVDLMKLVGIDSSLSARKELARELNYSGDTSDSASMNIWLHKEVIKKLAANGGKVPADLLD
jgi:hypothetical protein